jgi:hypothetical protein
VAERVVRAAAMPVLVTRAAVTPPRDVFERLTLVHDGSGAGPAARACAERLARLGGGAVIDGGPIAQCEAGVMRQASLVIMTTTGERPSWGLADPVAHLLGDCQRPVLFIPAP